MAILDTFYFVDFENVGIAGLKRAGQLSRSQVHVFSSQNSSKISTATLAALDLSKMVFHEVPSGNQSLDKHLVTYLGFLLGKHGSSARYVIVSKDAGYDSIVKFWKAKTGVTIMRQTSMNHEPLIRPSTKRTPLQKEKQPASGRKLEQATGNLLHTQHLLPSARKSSTPQQRTELNGRIMKLLSRAGYNNEKVIGPVASLVVKHHNDTNAKQVIYRKLIAKYGQNQASKVFSIIKGLL